MNDLDLEKIMEQIAEDIPLLIASLLNIIGGIYLLFDDYKDFGKMDHKGKYVDGSIFGAIREVFHHWHFGFIILSLGFISLILVIFRILVKLKIIQMPKDLIDKLLGQFTDLERNPILSKLRKKKIERVDII